MTTLALKIDHVSKLFSGKHALKDVSFGIAPGEVFGLLGPNGAGKTTLISAIACLLKPSSGSIEIFGHDNQKDPVTAKSLLGFVPQELINYGFFTVEQILGFHTYFYGVPKDREKIRYLLHKMDLYVHRNKLVSQLSGGMKRRLLIAKALLHSPGLLLLDEPTAGIDLHLRNLIWSFVEELRQENIAILLTTHYLEEAEHLCDRIGIIKEGELIQVDTTKELIDKSSSKTVTLLFKTPQKPISHPMLVKQSELEMRFDVPNSSPIFQCLNEVSINFDELADISVTKGRLEDVMNAVLYEGGKS